MRTSRSHWGELTLTFSYYMSEVHLFISSLVLTLFPQMHSGFSHTKMQLPVHKGNNIRAGEKKHVSCGKADELRGKLREMSVHGRGGRQWRAFEAQVGLDAVQTLVPRAHKLITEREQWHDQWHKSGGKIQQMSFSWTACHGRAVRFQKPLVDHTNISPPCLSRHRWEMKEPISANSTVTESFCKTCYCQVQGNVGLLFAVF